MLEMLVWETVRAFVRAKFVLGIKHVGTENFCGGEVGFSPTI
jgi:hypothetical protein